MAAGLRKAVYRTKYTPPADGFALQIREISGSCIVAGVFSVLNPPAFGCVPPVLGTRRQAPIRPSIGAHMKASSKIRLSSYLHRAKRSSVSRDRLAESQRDAGMRGWQALKRKEFRMLIASPLPTKTQL